MWLPLQPDTKVGVLLQPETVQGIKFLNIKWNNSNNMYKVVHTSHVPSCFLHVRMSYSEVVFL